MDKHYLWHKKLVELLIRPDFKPGHIRNCLIKIEGTGEKLIVPFRALRRRDKKWKLKISEVAITNQIIEYLEIKGWRVWKIYNAGVPAGVRDGKMTFRRKPEEYKGVPDLFAMKEGYNMLWLEVKGSGGKPSLEQQEFIDLAQKTYNGTAEVVKSLDEVMTIMNNIEILTYISWA